MGGGRLWGWDTFGENPGVLIPSTSTRMDTPSKPKVGGRRAAELGAQEE